MTNEPSKFEKLFVTLAPVLLVVAAILLIITMFQLDETKYTVKETAAYTRVSNCIVAKNSGAVRAPDSVEKCYIQVEKDSDLKLERFDEQLNNENPRD